MNLELLDRIICSSGLKRRVLAEKIGISYHTLWHKLQKGGVDFRVGEVIAISKVLNLDRDTRDKIFFDD